MRSCMQGKLSPISAFSAAGLESKADSDTFVSRLLYRWGLIGKSTCIAGLICIKLPIREFG
ncbi:hypothetical protein SAMN05444390_1012004 [Marinobacterium lutimaris]|uniref:Uncharacterized protein n=1 Tax=Marinobacterium lutimaris TaxID=568106 RepID=A0A1H5Z5H3_9GAMM|nr:hypothetical protein SAMN05444390_1012004 [Marinobacterium lutimaris]